MECGFGWGITGLKRGRPDVRLEVQLSSRKRRRGEIWWDADVMGGVNVWWGTRLKIVGNVWNVGCVGG